MQVAGVERLDGKWLVTANGKAVGACPSCSVPSTTRHGRYGRLLQDLPEQGTVVTLSVQVTRWQCRNSQCKRQTFSQLPSCITAPYARRTTRVAGLVQLLGHAAGGRPAERLMAQLGMPTSDDTILRHLKRQAIKSRTALLHRVVGIDDWGWIKGRRYGTLILDLERREVVDVLPDRSAESIAQWLSQHPEIEIISRDRCGLYAQGARQGAPQARQVADRFHLLQNLRERIEQQLSRGQALKTLASEVDPAMRSATSAIACSPHGQPELAVHRHLVKQARRDVRQAMFDRVRALADGGNSLIAIVRKTGFNWRTVAKWAQLAMLPPRRLTTPKPSSPAYCQAYLERRWAEGCKIGRLLLPEIRRLGYTGSFSHLERLLTQWRAAGSCRLVVTPASADSLPLAIDAATGQLISPIIASALCMKPTSLLTPRQVAKIQALKAESPEFVAMRQFVMRFRGIMRSGDLDKLMTWIDDVRRSGLHAMQRFARSLLHDLDAVRNAMIEPWSNGQTEGQINRLKTLKRAMYGRAGVELLRARMIPLRLPNSHRD
jgi:transposase